MRKYSFTGAYGHQKMHLGTVGTSEHEPKVSKRERRSECRSYGMCDD